jgi:zinc finger CCHC domain-containing protein 9
VKGVERRKVGVNGKMLCVSRCKPLPLSNNLAVAQCVFIATGKAQKTEDRRQGRVQDRNSNTTCFACRAKGHAAKDCPNVLLAAANTDLGHEEVEEQPSGDSRGLKRKKGKKGADLAGSSGRCYRQVSKVPYIALTDFDVPASLLRCDSSEHPLSRCPKPPSVGLPYAHCFICLEKGHLASKCPSNSRGIYPNGGSCKVCGSVQHRAQDCPDDKRGGPAPAVVLTEAEEELLKMKDDQVVLGTGREAGADEDDFMIVKRRRTEVERKHAEAQAQEKAAKKLQSAQQKRMLHRSQLMASSGGGEEEGGSSTLELLQSDQPTSVAHQEEAPPVKVLQVTKSAPTARSKPKVVVF